MHNSMNISCSENGNKLHYKHGGILCTTASHNPSEYYMTIYTHSYNYFSCCNVPYLFDMAMLEL